MSVEFLRPGPSHNQLLSPYTQYLAVCNDAGAAVVTVPYEQRVFERRLKELRYETGDERDRLDMLHEIGRDMGRILESVPGFTGAVSAEPGRTNTLVHLRLTLSAAELALLPFELAEVPVGSTASAVSVQTRPPVAVTRHIRTVPSDGFAWPERPRILFVASDRDDVPFEAHRAALVTAITPFLYPPKSDRGRTARTDGGEQFGDHLTILVGPTVAQVRHECEAQRFTHIHVLTHGDVDDFSSESYGVVLRGEDGSPEVVPGGRFVSAITPLGRLPTVVTIASCDSGNVGSVVAPGASFAHALHQAGIPLVIGSQFPLSKPGSVPLTARLYEGLLWGEHPLHVLQQARGELHARFGTQWHDWASIVVYESLPPNLDLQIEALRYSQARLAMNAALEGIDLAAASGAHASNGLVEPLKAVSIAIERLPGNGQFAVECLGLRASSRKRMAQAAFAIASQRGSAAGVPFEREHVLLDQARTYYAQAVRGLLVNDVQAVQRKATLHWVLVQLVSLAEVLGRELRPGEWEAAWLAAEHYLDHRDPEERAWAHASLAELRLIRLADPGLTEEQLGKFADEALAHAKELDSAYPRIDAFPVKSTRRQFERYASWWGTAAFREAMPPGAQDRRDTWSRRNGLVETAQRLIDILARHGPREVGGGTPPPPPPPAPPPAGPAPPSTYGGGPVAGATGGAASASASTSGTKPRLFATLGERRDGPAFHIEALPAGHGDCIWIEYGDRPPWHRVLIDCGTQGSSKSLLTRIDALPPHERVLDLFVLSHIDADHIGGAVPMLRAVRRGLRLGDLWFNGWRHVAGQLGARQAEMFTTAIMDLELPWNRWHDGAAIVTGDDTLLDHILPGGMKLTVLSPTRASLAKLGPVWKRELKRQGLEPGGRVDYSRLLKATGSTIADAATLQDVDKLADVKFTGDAGAPNGSSIALLAEFGGKSVLLAADAHAPVLVSSIQTLLDQRGVSRLKLDLFKVSHHGSQNNVSRELMELLDCSRYLISTNGDHFCHPDRQAIARLLKYGGDRKELYFNYNNRLTEVWGSAALTAVRERYDCVTHYPETDQPGIGVPLL
ncbi:CHAT domain-containing protein [Pseudaquabacterium terrae]|uniref:CHAT domain-containing protein n=1 Tax=Pseudaquabacterium terrae TaxID=2732868 RepID=UPI00156569B6